MDGAGEFYHVCTSGLSRSIMFRDDQAFVEGMNDIPACALRTGIKVYAFCLMDNHVHFILKGAYDACVDFIRQYKRLRSRAVSAGYPGGKCLDGAEITVKLIDDPEYLLTAIAYVLRNPMAAGISVSPGEYAWSSAGLYFGDKTFRNPGLRRFADMSGRELRTAVRSRIKYPDDYLLQADGIVFPGSYVEYRSVERMYGSPRQFLYYLSRNKDCEMEIDTGAVAKTRYRDGELAASMEALSRELFRGKGYSMLKIEDRIRLSRELRRRYGASVKQVARVTGLDYDILRQMNI